MTKDLQKAYEMVFNDMTNSGCGLLLGKYDARNGEDTYMHGVCMVMEWIAYRVNNDVGNAFSDVFIQNMMESEKKALKEVKKKS